MSEKLPFHETIVSTIQRSFHSNLGVLTPLIRRTKIPKNHDAIAQALREKIEYYDLANEFDMEGVQIKVALDEIEQQKQEAEAEAKANAEILPDAICGDGR